MCIEQFKIRSDRTAASVDKNLDEYIDVSIELARKLNDVGASLIVVAPLPEHPGLNPVLVSLSGLDLYRQLFARKPRTYLEERRNRILQKLNLAERSWIIFIFDLLSYSVTTTLLCLKGWSLPLR